MEEIKIFENAQFGQIRTAVTENGEPLFCLVDLCKAIEISNSRNVAARLDEDTVQTLDTTDTMGRMKQIVFVSEAGMYEVILRSNSEKAKSLDLKLFEIKKTVIQKPSGETIVTTTTKVTGKGQIYFVNKFLNGQQRKSQNKRV